MIVCTVPLESYKVKLALQAALNGSEYLAMHVFATWVFGGRPKDTALNLVMCGMSPKMLFSSLSSHATAVAPW